MPGLLSGSILRSGGSKQYITLQTAQPQLPPTPTTSTGYTIVTDSLLRTTYRTSLGNMEMTSGTIFSNIANHDITLAGTGTGIIRVTGGAVSISTMTGAMTGALVVSGGIGVSENIWISGGAVSTSTITGALVVHGGIGVSENIWTGRDITVNGLTIGQGWSGPDNQGYNNIAIRGQAQPSPVDVDNGQESIAIGYDVMVGSNGVGGLETSNKSIAIGRYALYTGTGLSNTIAIGDSALKNAGSYHTETAGAVTAATSTDPIVVTVNNHGLVAGTEITFSDVGGMEFLNGQIYYANPIDANTLEIYSDVSLLDTVSGIGYPAYTSGGELNRVLKWDNNIAIGTSAGVKFYNGEQNFFIGDNVAQHFTTGSYNFFIGHDVANNMTRGNANIAIGGDNLVDGVDSQINIGSVFYYNGGGYLVLNADTGVGLGTESTSTDSGAFNVYGGAGISGNLHVGGSVNAVSGVFSGITTVTNTTSAISTTTGALQVAGGVGIGGNLHVGGTIYGTATTATDSNNVFINTATSTTTYYLALDKNIGVHGPLASDIDFTYVTTSSVTSEYFNTGTNVLNVPGSIFSNNGGKYEENLLYTPRTEISTDTFPPVEPRVGDFWIDPGIGALMQYWQDGDNRFWIQISTIG